AQRTQAQAYPRFSCPHGHQERPPGSGPPSCQGSCAPERLIAHRPPSSARPPARQGRRAGEFALSGDQRFTKQQRLLKAADYGAVFKAADFKVSTPFLLILAKDTGQDQARLGLVISKKNVGCAVRRNRVK